MAPVPLSLPQPCNMATNENPKQQPLSKEWLTEQYLRLVNEHKSRPGSIYEVAKLLGLEKKAVQHHFKTITVLEQSIWESIIEETFQRLNAEPAYAEYVARERLLAFYFTLLEVLQPYREYVKQVPLTTNVFGWGGDVFEGFRKAFKNYTQGLVDLGLETGEVEKRTFLTDKYQDALWAQCLFILGFWAKDNSENYEKTDEAVERSVNLSLDLMARGPMDTLLEFGQFLFKNR